MVTSITKLPAADGEARGKNSSLRVPWLEEALIAVKWRRKNCDKAGTRTTPKWYVERRAKPKKTILEEEEVKRKRGNRARAGVASQMHTRNTHTHTQLLLPSDKRGL